MAGQASGGQLLTPNNNVVAVAGIGGDKWGAFGGGITPAGIDPGVSNVKQTISNGQRETNSNYQINLFGAANTLLADMSVTAVSGQTADGGQQQTGNFGPLTADDNTQTTWTADQESPGVADSML